MRKHEIKILKICIAVAVASLILLISLCCYIYYRRYHFVDEGNVIAKVGGYKVHEKSVALRLKYLSDKFGKKIDLNNIDDELVKAVLLEHYVDHKVFRLAKKKDNLNDIKLMAKDFYRKAVVKNYIDNVVFEGITEEEIKKRYDEISKTMENREEREIQHILLSSEEEAQRTQKLILRNGDFEYVARKRSLDKSSAVRDGSIGYIIKEELTTPEFADIVFLLKEGEISKPIETKDGWHIVKVKNIRNVKVKSYRDSRKEILESIKNERYEQFLQDLGVEKAANNIKILGKITGNLGAAGEVKK